MRKIRDCVWFCTFAPTAVPPVWLVLHRLAQQFLLDRIQFVFRRNGPRVPTNKSLSKRGVCVNCSGWRAVSLKTVGCSVTF